ncbi:MAG: hypothetical protein IJ124_10435 [Clostridia bacterium]|nr:hypothetical protein [Clostridia bacterium]
MMLEVVQQDKELYEARFLIRQDGSVVGRMALRGSVGTIEGDWDIALYGSAFSLSPEGSRMGSPQRPYTLVADGVPAGRLFQARQKHGLLNSYDYVEMRYMGGEYSLYSVMLGDKGKCPIYLGDGQVAQIDKDFVVYDDLHHYRLYALKAEDAVVATLLCAYLYVTGPFKPGVKVTVGCERNYGKTINKLLLGKYDPAFVSKCAGR